MKTEYTKDHPLYVEFKEALNIQHDMRPGANPYIIKCIEITEEYASQFKPTPSSTEQLRRIRVKSIIPGAMGICDYHLENGEVITCKPNELVSEYDKKYGSDTVVKCIAHGDCKGNPCIYPECMTKDLLNAEAFYNSRSRNSTPSSTVDLEREAEELFPYYNDQSDAPINTQSERMYNHAQNNKREGYIQGRQTTSQKGLEELIEWMERQMASAQNKYSKGALRISIRKATELLTKK